MALPEGYDCMEITINSISAREFERAAQQVEQYAKDLERKNAIFVKRLAEIGLQVAKERMAFANGDSVPGTLKINTTSDGEFASAELNLTGRDILFIEFGAGIRYNSGNSHPLEGQYGYGVGTYNPESDKAFSPYGWWYTGDDGQSHHSWGTEATMPMYSASQQMYDKAVQIAKEVFGT